MTGHELLPSHQLTTIREGLAEYLRTTFALADDDAGARLQEFLTDRKDGIFKGPFLRLRLPFQAADEGWRDHLDWYEGPTPYGHQAASFERLSSARLNGERPRPLPTLVTTGTGSGKTEAFLVPILDHVLRARREGVTGTKALILYPMNALANDQAGRLARLIAGSTELSGVTAALYTGEEQKQRTKVTADGLITDRTIIRKDAPDIVLTNYKMLDQMLLRDADARIWEQSAHSLQYLVLDEFHTYDGAQGTDVSMLLRRLGLVLHSHRSDEEWTRPLGDVTPVATSATLGDKGDPTTMLEFARTVFGDDELDERAVITESRLSPEEWHGGGPADRITGEHVTAVLELLRSVDPGDGEAVARAVLNGISPSKDPQDEGAMLTVLKVQHLTHELVSRCSDAVHLSDLLELVPTDDAEEAETFLLAYVAALSHVRATVGREALSVDLHLWVRELTRIDRAASSAPAFSWSDDGARASDDTVLPAIYCRHCGRSGWAAALAPTGWDLDVSDDRIRARKAAGDGKVQPLVYAPAEGDAVLAGGQVDGLVWLSTTARTLTVAAPEADDVDWLEGRTLPVLTHREDDRDKRSRDDWCPSCQRVDGIRFLGSAVATMLSVSLSTLFGTRGLDPREKKALVFTDSVQDAAHRAGFVQSRSHALTLRSVLRDAMSGGPVALDVLVERVLDRAGTPSERYRLLPPDLADRDDFVDFWHADTVSPKARARVRRRLLLDVSLELGLQSRIGRTLEMTGTAAARVDQSAETLRAAGRWTLDEAAQQTLDDPPTDAELIAWVRGVLERMRERGALAHEWFARYQHDDGKRYSIWGGRPRHEGMPAFPRGRAAPGYPRVGSGTASKDSDLDPVTGAQSWYAQWTARCLGLAPMEGGLLARLLLDRLADRGVVDVVRSGSDARVYQLRPETIVVEPIDTVALQRGDHRLECSTCHTQVPVAQEVREQLDGAPCMVVRCAGRLEAKGVDDNFYRRMYASSDVHRVVAREHTSQLDDATRLEYEEGFKASHAEPDSPNVLVATPTLEMGIDIGDLSTVVLASLPRSVASYLQRVGRAGRLTGNALDLAFVTGRGDQLPRLGDPLSVINGEVRPPATYLDAEEILRRQYVASVADRMARDVNAIHPRRATEAMNAESGGYLRALIDLAESDAEANLESFLRGFPSLSKESVRGLREWATPATGEHSSPLAARLFAASHRWAQEIETLGHRIDEVQASLDELQQKAQGPAATEDDKAAYRTALAAVKINKATIARLRGDYWIGVLEEHGVLPNYTLLDDSVDLDVALSWIDPETGDYQSEPQTFRRAASLALRDFAPGAKYYGRGHRIEVDAVDLGHQAESVRTWVLCPGCGFTHDVTDDAVPTECPRCSTPAIADVKQRVDVVELTKVSSAMRREESLIDDARDERDRERFTIVPLADVDPAKLVKQWYVSENGFGVKHLRDMTIRWLNVGRTVAQGRPLTLSEQETAATLFRVCSSCGQLDKQSSRNSASEHRPWCPNRRKAEESTKELALYRELRTEGLVVRLPSMIALGDSFAVPSLSAALLLGLRELIGGAPDHIAVETAVDPAPGDDTNHDALLLHDVVPGGTGYLADLADPETFRDVLQRALDVLEACPCTDEERLACHRCLLPFAPPGRTDLVSRSAAEQHLRSLLLDGGAWSLVEEPVESFDPETVIEKKFRAVLTERLVALGAHVSEKPGPNGNRLLVKRHKRTWSLEPQQHLLGAKPDFLLQCDQPLPKVAIFCDGWAFHASPAHNRIADDAQKRRDLRDAGHMVMAVTWEDLEAEVAPPAWFDPGVADLLKVNPQADLDKKTVGLVSGSAIDQLVAWIDAPDPDQRQRLADWMPMFLFGRATQGKVPADVDPASVALEVLDGGALPADGLGAWAWRDGATVALARAASMTDVTLALVVDDDTVLGPAHRKQWREWLRLSNLLNLRSRPTTITCRSLVGSLAPTGGDADVADLPAAWRELHSQATENERRLLAALAEAGAPRPVLGAEVLDGIAIDIAWPDDRVALAVDMAPEDVEELTAAGWRISSEVADIMAALDRRD